jgi:hypothetical protein
LKASMHAVTMCGGGMCMRGYMYVCKRSNRC